MGSGLNGCDINGYFIILQSSIIFTCKKRPIKSQYMKRMNLMFFYPHMRFYDCNLLKGGGAWHPGRPRGRACIAWGGRSGAITESRPSRRAAVTAWTALTPQKILQDPSRLFSLLHGDQSNRGSHDRSERDMTAYLKTKMKMHLLTLILFKVLAGLFYPWNTQTHAITLNKSFQNCPITLPQFSMVSL